MEKTYPQRSLRQVFLAKLQTRGQYRTALPCQEDALYSLDFTLQETHRLNI